MTDEEWWVIEGEELLYALRRVQLGDDPDDVYGDLRSDSNTQIFNGERSECQRVRW
jgi:hypothetical protein